VTSSAGGPEAPQSGSTAIAAAAAALREGGLVAFPTETVYGLGADATSPAAVRRLFRVKGRPADHPVIVHGASLHHLAPLVTAVSGHAAALADACWPGPLTLVLPRSPRVPDEVTGGLSTVGVRVPAQHTALALLREFGGGVAAPSANRFGRVSPTTADDVRADLGADVDVVLDGGPCRVGVESTIVDCSGSEPAILRLGGLPRERVDAIVGRSVPVVDNGEVRAPGTRAAHYAPAARVVVVDAAALDVVTSNELAAGARVGVIATRAGGDLPQGAAVLGVAADDEQYAHWLYRWLRDADAHGLDVVVAVEPSSTGIGAAVADRLRRAAAATSVVA
jgi:L-threonylcarbamoyladenylate synthase